MTERVIILLLTRVLNIVSIFRYIEKSNFDISKNRTLIYQTSISEYRISIHRISDIFNFSIYTCSGIETLNFRYIGIASNSMRARCLLILVFTWTTDFRCLRFITTSSSSHTLGSTEHGRPPPTCPTECARHVKASSCNADGREPLQKRTKVKTRNSQKRKNGKKKKKKQEQEQEQKNNQKK